MIDEYDRRVWAHQRVLKVLKVLKVQKWQKMVRRRAIRGPSLTILGHSGPLDKAPQGRHSPLSFSNTLPTLDQSDKNGN